MAINTETTLKVHEDQCLTWDYNGEADVLYVSFGEPRAALAIDMGEGVLILRREEDGEMVGITIIGAADMLQRKVSPARDIGRSRSR